jgi:hypothetical protein
LEYGHLAASLTEGKGLAVILYDEPLEVPPLDAILQGDVEVICFPPTTQFQTGATNKLVLSSSHAGPTMIQILPEAEMGKNPEIGLTQMNKNGNLQDRIRVQVGQVQIVKIKETVEEGRNGKSKGRNMKRNIDDGLMSVLRRNNNPAANPPRIESFWR